MFLCMSPLHMHVGRRCSNITDWKPACGGQATVLLLRLLPLSVTLCHIMQFSLQLRSIPKTNLSCMMQAAGAIAGHYEAEAVTAARAALQLSSLPSDCCSAHLALGRAHLALHSIQLGPAGHDAAWTSAPAVATAVPPASLPGTTAAVEVTSDTQVIRCIACVARSSIVTASSA